MKKLLPLLLTLLLNINANAVVIPSAAIHQQMRINMQNQREQQVNQITPIFTNSFTCVSSFRYNREDYKNFNEYLDELIAKCKSRNKRIKLGDLISFSIIERPSNFTSIYLIMEIKE